ncbi:YwiC-like family protein [Corynebacterium alimapuense]|uniref:YwiC-like family protein n=1 Tax=Corynebacterium alimapuense TaxID=1576874 RepID=A0A3M8K8M7_9CORY|nr:YwiC-like family protein [Corynebacterium alimapuense]RNE49571.1 hypothetical protein C5L39_04280 [Corynebacterium alimapuense]
MTAPVTVAPSRKKRRSGVSPWIPNQHGAWAMLITPAIVGTAAGIAQWVAAPESNIGSAVTIPLILIAWFFGYFAFFAFGLVIKARSAARRARYLRPLTVYGSVSLVALVVALVISPQLLWWALPFAPLVLIAVWETLQHRPRSLLSGVSTTLASALLVPVLAMAGLGAETPIDVPLSAWGSAAFLALYFSGTIPFVKTMIRQRGNRRYLIGSISYHVVAAALVIGAAVAWAGGLAGWLMAATMVVALVRSIAVPLSAQRGRAWSAKQVGMMEGPVILLASIAVLFAVM